MTAPDPPPTEGKVNENPQSWYELNPFAGKSVALGEIGREGE